VSDDVPIARDRRAQCGRVLAHVSRWQAAQGVQGRAASHQLGGGALGDAADGSELCGDVCRVRVC
jgi:hypothetical protein